MNPILRSQIIEHVLSEYVAEHCGADCLNAAEPEQEVLTDLLTDLRHHCDRHKLDFDYAVWISAMHWSAESIA